jgi:hypothetical protein
MGFSRSLPEKSEAALVSLLFLPRVGSKKQRSLEQFHELAEVALAEYTEQ